MINIGFPSGAYDKHRSHCILRCSRPPCDVLGFDTMQYVVLHFLRGSSAKLGTIQRRLAGPLRKDDMHKSRNVNSFILADKLRKTKKSTHNN